MIEKKEISAILEHEFMNFLEKTGESENFRSGLLKCHICGETITEENIALILKPNGYEYICDKQECLSKYSGATLC